LHFPLLLSPSAHTNDELTKRVKRTLKSGRKMRIDADGRSVDVKTGGLIGPDPAIEQPLTRAQLGKAVVRRPAQSRSQADHDAAALTRISWNISVMLEVYRSAHPRG
jgi:hypothetical protein